HRTSPAEAGHYRLIEPRVNCVSAVALISALPRDRILEHRIRVRRRVRDALEHVPVLDDLAIIVEPEDIDAGPVAIARPLLVTVQHDELALGDRALELDALARVLTRHALEVIDEGLLTVRDAGIVLGIRRARKADYRFGRIALVEHQIVERDHGRLVMFEVVGHTSTQEAGTAASRWRRGSSSGLPRRSASPSHRRASRG